MKTINGPSRWSSGWPSRVSMVAVRRGSRRPLSGVAVGCRQYVDVTFARRGLTLLEIILALTIFFGAMAALSQLSWSGSRSAIQARLKTQAIIRCEAKLAEVLAGAESLQPKTNVAFPDDPKWTYSVSIGESQFPDLLAVQVMVAHSGGSSLANVQFTLNRWMRDPSIFLDAAEKQQAEADAAAQSQGATQ
jgi:general secretion pathway protein I